MIPHPLGSLLEARDCGEHVLTLDGVLFQVHSPHGVELLGWRQEYFVCNADQADVLQEGSEAKLLEFDVFHPELSRDISCVEGRCGHTAGGAAVLEFDTLHQASSELEVGSTQGFLQ